jgi:hypothetical protein
MEGNLTCFNQLHEQNQVEANLTGSGNFEALFSWLRVNSPGCSSLANASSECFIVVIKVNADQQLRK